MLDAPMINFSVSPIEMVRIGFIGLGSRGLAAVERYTHIDGTRVAAVCDLCEEKVKGVRGILDYSRGVSEYYGLDAWKSLCENPSVDLVYICTDWQSHAEIACYAMECGRHVAIEVPAATSMEDCFRLVRTAERTRRHCMMLENCIYDLFEASVENMVKDGLFGNVYHAEGGYIHTLQYLTQWRSNFNRIRKGDNYPTHGLAPVCRLMDINRSDKLYSIVSTSVPVKEGSHTVSLIRTVNGRSIVLQHNIYANSPYSRQYGFYADKGSVCKYPEPRISFSSESWISKEEMDALMERYRPEYYDYVLKIMPDGTELRRYMDYAMDYRLIYCLRNGFPLDTSVYDAALWSCVSELSHQSIEKGSVPVFFPNFILK